MSASLSAPMASLPIDSDQAARLQALLGDLDVAGLAWVSGYAAGLAAARNPAGAAGLAAPTPPVTAARTAATVLYASQTGNARRLAERLGRQLESAGLAARVVSVADYATRELAQERLLYVVASTQGDGDPPEDARAFFDFLTSRRAPRLEQLGYAVLALGDSSYPQFCATGRAIDERLGVLGARRLEERVDCDVEFEPLAQPWLERVVTRTRSELGTLSGAPQLALVKARPTVAAEAPSRDAPAEIELLANQRISAAGAVRDVRHLELGFAAGRLTYEPGDALGVEIDNPADLVAQVLQLTRLDPGTAVRLGDTELTLGAWLAHRREVTRVGRPLIEHLAASGAREPAEWLAAGGSEGLRHALRQLQVTDLLRRHPIEWDAVGLVRALQGRSPRLYSIASSQAAVGDEAHLTVAVLADTLEGRARHGAISWQLAALEPGTQLKTWIEPNPRFRLPADGARDVIMIGAGTGVAPFRGFLQHRVETHARGRNWLLFGARHLERDFLYQLEWLEALKREQLQRLDVAFSRDGSARRYVQHCILEQGAELYRWLEQGAHLYVCGDAQRMAPDVHAALLAVIARHGGRDEQAASDYLNGLAAERRYSRDVY